MIESGMAALAAQIFAFAVFCVGAVSKKKFGPMYRTFCLGVLVIAAGLPLAKIALPDIKPETGAIQSAPLFIGAKTSLSAAESAGGPYESAGGPPEGVYGFFSQKKFSDAASLLCLAICAACLAGIASASRDWISYAAWRGKAMKKSDAIGKKCRVALRAWDGPATSCGFFKPIVFLPRGMNPESAEYRAMEAHELAHARLGHFGWNALQAFIARLLWWNPLCSRLLAQGRVEREIEADGLAAAACGKIAYAETLLLVAERNEKAESSAKGSLPPALVSAWESDLVERVDSLARRGKKVRGSVILRWCVAALSFSLACVGGKTAPFFAPSLFAQAMASSGNQAAAPVSGPVSLFPKSGRAARISLPFGDTVNPLTGKPYYHEGIDLPAFIKEPIGVFAAGRVAKTGRDANRGIFVEIDHEGGYRSYYLHLDGTAVKEGDSVKAGEIIGSVGVTGLTTGPHLHFGLQKDGRFIDPEPFVKIEK